MSPSLGHARGTGVTRRQRSDRASVLARHERKASVKDPDLGVALAASSGRRGVGRPGANTAHSANSANGPPSSVKSRLGYA
jgi:hypothetical protein